MDSGKMFRMNRRSLPADESGVVLIATLLAIAIFTVLVVQFFKGTWIESSLSGGFRDGIKASYAVKSGVNLARLILREQAEQSLSFDALNQKWAGGVIPLPVDGQTAFVRITDESGKVNINNLISNAGYPDKKTRELVERLFVLLDVGSDLADTIQDWIDKDDVPLDRGAENSYYQGLSRPYTCKNARLDSLEELLLVRGVTREVYNKIGPFLTVHSDPYVNVNTAEATVLQSLDERITPDLAMEIVQYRNQTPFEQKEEIKRVPGMEEIFPKISLLIGVKSNYFSVVADADFNETPRRAQAVLFRSGNHLDYLYFRVS